MSGNDSDDVMARCICFVCVGESWLSEEIEQKGEVAQCAYCHQTEKTFTLEEMANRIEAAFDDHYTRTSDQPNSWQQSLMSDQESTYDWERDGEPVTYAIENAAQIPTEAAEDIQTILNGRCEDIEAAKMGEETEFSSETYYEEKGSSDWEWQEEWRDFEQSLRAEARFFNRSGAAHLTSVFGQIDKLETKDGKPLVVDAGPTFPVDHLYRARVFQSDNKLEEALCRPDLHVGSPASAYASAGRMNARGISVFYGATEASVAVAEVRPPVGSRVAVARFSIIRPLRLLDLTALSDVQDGGSIFDPTLKRRLERVAFLRTLGRWMTRPVMPDDEAFDYLGTQAIADFLATENEPSLDGIIFRSAQSQDGRNVVLFHRAARVETLQFPEGTEIAARTGYSTEEGWEDEYAVSEVIPQSQKSTQKGDEDWPALSLNVDPAQRNGTNHRDPTLRIDLASVEVHQIKWVTFESTAFEVNRHRYEKRDFGF
jgi:hypothetical protein